MSAWKILPQVVKEKDGMETEVPVKEIKFMLFKNPKTKEEYWGSMKRIVVRVLFQHKNEKDWEFWKATLSASGFNITCPDRRVLVSDRPFETEYKTVPGNRFRKGQASCGAGSLRQFIEEMRNIGVNDELIGEIGGLLQAEYQAALKRAEERAAAKAAQAEAKKAKQKQAA